MKAFFLFLLVLAFLNSEAQNSDSATVESVQTIDGIVHEVLEIISGEKGETRDWDTFRSLFLPTATFTVLYHSTDFPSPSETVSLDDFIESMDDAYYEMGFWEYEIGKRVDEYNGIAHVFQAYTLKDSEGYEGNGITSYQLVYFDKRWWINSIVWTGDENGVRVPEEYIEKK